MKKMMLTGGMTGFALGILCGCLTEGATWPGILVRSSLGALALGWLLKWWMSVLLRCLADTALQNSSGAQNPIPVTGHPVNR